ESTGRQEVWQPRQSEQVEPPRAPAHTYVGDARLAGLAGARPRDARCVREATELVDQADVARLRPGVEATVGQRTHPACFHAAATFPSDATTGFRARSRHTAS